MTSFEAVYFVAPIKDSVERMIDDFPDDERKYKSAHIFFTDCKHFLLACCAPIDLTKVTVASVRAAVPD